MIFFLVCSVCSNVSVFYYMCCCRSLVEEIRKVLCALWDEDNSTLSPDSLFSVIWRLVPRFRYWVNFLLYQSLPPSLLYLFSLLCWPFSLLIFDFSPLLSILISLLLSGPFLPQLQHACHLCFHKLSPCIIYSSSFSSSSSSSSSSPLFSAEGTNSKMLMSSWGICWTGCTVSSAKH